MYKRFIKTGTLCLASTILCTAYPSTAHAAKVTGEQPVAGISVSLDYFYGTAAAEAILSESRIADLVESESETEDMNGQEQVEESVEEPEEPKEKEEVKSKYDKIGIAVVDNYLNIRESPGEDKKIIGKLPKDAGCTIYGIDEDGWAKIRSGKVTGYVLSDYLVSGEEAEKLAEKVGMQTAIVNTTTLKVREKPSTDAVTLTLIPMEEELEVVKDLDDWVKVIVDNDEGYVSKEFVNISYELKKAVFVEELKEDVSSGVSSVRAQIVAYAKQFLGNPYVWGGTSLTNGADCSGYVLSLFQHFGYSLNRTSGAQAGNGTSISVSSVRPGDLVFYSNGSRINHVAMSIGNGQVIHASNPRSGIKISNMNYRTPIKAVRIINE